uniref:Uncharacterized protein n=1 Tax=Strongyloides venezuelensis TaxID=75913 RepID=A0A0K0F5V8_STRVS
MKFSYLLLTFCLITLQLHIPTIECYALKSIGEIQKGTMEIHSVFKRSFFSRLGRGLRSLGRKIRKGLKRNLGKKNYSILYHDICDKLFNQLR